MGVKVPFAISDSTYARAVAIPVYHADTKNRSDWLFKQNGDGTGIPRKRVRGNGRAGTVGFRSRHTGCGRIAGYGFLSAWPANAAAGDRRSRGPGYVSGTKARFPLCFLFFGIYYHYA